MKYTKVEYRVRQGKLWENGVKINRYKYWLLKLLGYAVYTLR